MWEFEVIWYSGERDIIFGYSLTDACRRSKRDTSEVQNVLIQEYID